MTLDDRAADGMPGEGDNVHSDVEDVVGSSVGLTDPTVGGEVTLAGNSGANVLTVDAGSGVLDGGPEIDVLNSGVLDDRFTSRDGFADRGDGVDTVIADSLDTVSPSCENVDVADLPAPAPAAPVVAPQPPAPTQPAAPAGRATPRLSLAVSPGRDRKAPFRFRATGALSGVAKAACTPGRVTVRVAAGSKTVAARAVALKADCTYSLRLDVPGRARRGPLEVTATFAGNTLLSPATSKTRTVRAG